MAPQGVRTFKYHMLRHSSFSLLASALETPAVVASVGHVLSMAVICAGSSPAPLTTWLGFGFGLGLGLGLG